MRKRGSSIFTQCTKKQGGTPRGFCFKSRGVNDAELSAPAPSRFARWIKSEILDWPVWWGEQPIWRRVGPAGFVALYLPALFLLGSIRIDHFGACALLLALCYGGRSTQPALRFMLPLFWTGVVYDSQRFYSDYIRGPVHVAEPYDFDKFFFGINSAEGILTPNEYWQKHTHWFLDLITGLAYLIFIAVYALCAGWFTFGVMKRGKRDFRAMWAFFFLNVIGYSTYYWYAAAPPWYVALYGLGPANMNAQANPAGCLRFDELLGTHFFTGMYGRSADVFGAIPSLHIAYPLQAVYYAFRLRSLRGFTVFFYVLMCFSAVYLNHHYVLDILWGSVYAIAVTIGVDVWYARKGKPLIS